MGNFASYIAQSFPPKPKFGPENVPDLTGKVIVVTGGNGGIGYEIIKVLLLKNAKVYMASRSRERAEVAIAKLKDETGKEAIFLELDLADLKSVRKATDEFKLKETALHVLFNNGGVMNTPIGQLTKDGIDFQFGVNVVGHYLFTKRLIPLLETGAKSSSDGKSHVVHTSSSAMMFAKTVSIEAMKDVTALKKLGSLKLYPESKFANLILSNEFARRYGYMGIMSNSVNPGNLKTNLQRHTTPVFMALFGWLFSPAPYGALTPLYAGVSPETASLNGKYFIPWARLADTRPDAKDGQLGEKLWNWLEAETKE